MDTEKIIFSQIAKYPKSNHWDIFKALYQSVFGCGHLISDISHAVKHIEIELNALPSARYDIECLGLGYCRVHLGYLKKHSIAVDSFARLLAISAAGNNGTTAQLEEKLAVFLELTKSEKLPFIYNAVVNDINKWRQAGYPPCHHSQLYREAYAPVYRVLDAYCAKLLPILEFVDSHSNDALIIAIDGNSGAGKSYLAKMLNTIYNCNVFHMDDYFLRPEQRTAERFSEPGGNVDRERFLEEVLLPLSNKNTVEFKPFACSTFTLGDSISVPFNKLNIIEGSYSMHPELQKYYDYSIFLSISEKSQQERIIMREPNMSEIFFSKWIPLENIYFNTFDIKNSCDLIIDIG